MLFATQTAIVTTFALKHEEIDLTTCHQYVLKCCTNSVAPDQMPHAAASDLGRPGLLKSVCPNIGVNVVVGFLKYPMLAVLLIEQQQFNYFKGVCAWCVNSKFINLASTHGSKII